MRMCLIAHARCRYACVNDKYLSFDLKTCRVSPLILLDQATESVPSIPTLRCIYIYSSINNKDIRK